MEKPSLTQAETFASNFCFVVEGAQLVFVNTNK